MAKAIISAPGSGDGLGLRPFQTSLGYMIIPFAKTVSSKKWVSRGPSELVTSSNQPSDGRQQKTIRLS